MTTNPTTAPIDDARLSLICGRIENIYRQVQTLLPLRNPSSMQIRATPASEAIARGPRSRLDAVDDAFSGLNYAVWCIGEAVAALAGRDGLERVFEMIEARDEGTRISSWLDHRWDGVPIGDGVWTC